MKGLDSSNYSKIPFRTNRPSWLKKKPRGMSKLLFKKKFLNSLMSFSNITAKALEVSSCEKNKFNP